MEKVKHRLLSEISKLDIIFLLACILLAVLPLSIVTSQNWSNIVPTNILWGVFLILLSLLSVSNIFAALKKDRWFYLFSAAIFLLFLVVNGYVEYSYISVVATIFALRLISFLKPDGKLIPLILLVVLFALLIKFPFFSWDGTRLNFGLGNPNHASYVIASLFMVAVWRGNILMSLALGLVLLYLKCFGGIFSLIMTLLVKGIVTSFPRPILQRSNAYIVSTVSLFIFLSFVIIFKFVLGTNERSFREALVKYTNNGSITAGIVKKENNPWTLSGNSIFDLSGYARVYQFDGFLKIDKATLFIGNEAKFVSKNLYSLHNNLLGIIVVFGLPFALVYLIMLNQIFKSQAYKMLAVVPILAIDTVVSFYGIYFVFFYLCVRATEASEQVSENTALITAKINEQQL